jgi:hypothetical protein
MPDTRLPLLFVLALLPLNDLAAQTQVTSSSGPCNFSFGPELVSQGPYACQVWYQCDGDVNQFDYFSVSYTCSQAPVNSNGDAYANIGGCCAYGDGSISRYDPPLALQGSNYQACNGTFSGTYSLYTGNC